MTSYSASSPSRAPAGLLVATGAALGAVSRYLITVGFGDGAVTILLINVAACLAMGYFRPGAFWGTGFLGGFSTFSAVAAALAASTAGQALLHAVIHLSACIAAVLLGRWLQRSRRAS